MNYISKRLYCYKKTIHRGLKELEEKTNILIKSGNQAGS